MKARIRKTELEIPLGYSIGEASREAIKISMEHNCNVEFTFNGKRYEYLFDDLIASCKITKQ